MINILVIITLGSLGVACNQTTTPYQKAFEFGDAVRFQVKDSDHFCNGIIRNPLLFNYYQIDRVACHYKDQLGGKGFDHVSSKIVHKDDMTWLYTQREDKETGYQSYIPLDKQDIERAYYQDKQGKWRANLDSEEAKRKIVEYKRDYASCAGYINGFYLAKSNVCRTDHKNCSKFDTIQPFDYKACTKQYPTLKNFKGVKTLAEFLKWMKKHPEEKDRVGITTLIGFNYVK